MADTFSTFGQKSTQTKPKTGFDQYKTQQTGAPAPAPTPATAPTFASLQQQGIARPAPPPAMAPNITYGQTGGLTPGRVAPGPTSTGPIPGQPNQNLAQLLQQLMGYGLQNPSAYNSDVLMDSYNRIDRRMADQFDVDRQNINEDSARRGINFSTIPVGRLGDVAIRQGQARSDLASSLLQDQARTYGSDRSSIIGQAMGYGQNAFQNQLDTARFNSDEDYRNQQLMLALLGYS